MKPIPELHPGDCIKYEKYGHIFTGIVRAINDEYFFRNGDIQRAYLTTHQGWGNVPVRFCEILGIDTVSQS